MRCKICDTELKKFFSISRFNQKRICPKCDLSDALFEDRLKLIIDLSIQQGHRSKRNPDIMEFLSASV